MFPPFSLVSTVRSWPVESQRRARGNALTASTALARLRAEREDVDDFLAHHDHPTTPVTAPLARVALG